jgi:hypothetical protein
MTDKLQELLAQRRKLDAEIEAESRHQVDEAAVRMEALHKQQHPKLHAMSKEQQNWCYFMGYDPDNPDIPTD